MLCAELFTELSFLCSPTRLVSARLRLWGRKRAFSHSVELRDHAIHDTIRGIAVLPPARKLQQQLAVSILV